MAAKEWLTTKKAGPKGAGQANYRLVALEENLGNRAGACTRLGIHTADTQQGDIALTDMAVGRIKLHPQGRGTALAFHHAFVDLANLGFGIAAVIKGQVADYRHIAEVGVDSHNGADIAGNHLINHQLARAAVVGAVAAGARQNRFYFRYKWSQNRMADWQQTLSRRRLPRQHRP